MATPTPGKHASSQSVATPPVSTPFSASNHHPAFSPHGPRSVVPSPQQFKKSPANSNTLYGYPSGGGHPTNSSFGAAYDSPSAAIALGGVPGLTELGLDGMGALVRGDEDERKRKLQHVLEILKTNKGRLSEAGIERLARRVGLECLWEGHMGSGGGTRTLIIAGSALALDIDFSNNVVKKVSLSFPESPKIVTRHAENAGEILLRDLQFAPNETPLTKQLDRFAANLEQLAALDKLSVIPGLNCHEAIAGVYESLERLHRWEVSKLKGQEAGTNHEYFAKMAMCTKSGKPAMHTRDRLGLSLDYWQEKRQIEKKVENAEEGNIWSLLVECASLPALVYTPLRVSEKWISPDIQKSYPPAEELFLATGDSPILDWLQPDNTLLPSTDPAKADPLEGIDQAPNQKYPEVTFVAKFDPPLLVPYGLALQIYGAINAPLDMYQTSTFDGLMFPHGPEEKIEQGDARTIKRKVTVPVFGQDAEKSFHIHKNTLFIEKIDYGRILTELPFSHPRQLVEMLPALRQYAFLSTILRNSFGDGSNVTPAKEKLVPEETKRHKFTDFMDNTSIPEDSTLSIDVSFTAQPIPRLQAVFPFKNKTANVTFDINLNGVVQVISQNLLDENSTCEGKGKGKMLGAADLGKMLEITENLGIWIEFVKRRLG